MEKKNIIISWIVLLFVIAWGSYYYTMANDDYTCYNYTSSVSCEIQWKTFSDASAMSWVSCTSWNNWVSDCSWNVQTTTYTRWSSYRCWNWNDESKTSYNVNGQACTVRYTDTQAPNVSDWGIE